MKNNYLLFFVLLFLNFIYCQEKKYPSLLWEISGKNLTKKSYLYGTMHVSDKVSYHLSDAFFKHLLEVDFVANESDPSTWNQVSDLYTANFPNYSMKFYKNFVLFPFKRENLYQLFLYNNYSVNSLLYRTNDYSSDFQEETYLDMYIYQIGRKFNKKVIGLEDVFQSIIMVKDINFDNIKPNIENQKLLAKILNGKTYDVALKDYYREKNLDMIDSLTNLGSSKEELNGILYKRNDVMLKSMDSIMQKGSLFAAVGAAHLPGKKGLIESLRKKGYKVTPIISNYTEISKNQKKKIDQLFITPKVSNYSSSDRVINSKVLEDIQHQQAGKIISSDLANGSFMQIQRIPLHNFLLENEKRISHLSLDSLFYENIKGDIKSKIFSENEIYKKYDIKNKTKSGDFQRHQFYLTPLELIGVNFSGKFDYINKYESLIFDAFNLNIPTKGYQQINPKFSNFSVKMPNYSVVYGEDSEKSKDDLQIYGYDFNTKSYYFLLEKTSTTFPDFEQKSYELKRIQEEFLIEYDAKRTMNVVKSDENQCISNASIKNKNSYLKTIIIGNKYYLLGIVNGSMEQATDYFDSFKINQTKIDNDFKRFQPKESPISFELPFEKNKSIFLLKDVNQNGFNRLNTKKTNHFEAKDKYYSINSLFHPSVMMSIKPFQKYQNETNLDSIVVNLKNNLLTDKTVDNLNVEEDYSVADELENSNYDIDNDNETILNSKTMSYYDYYGATNIGEIKSEWEKKLGFDVIKNRKLKIEQEKTYKDVNKKYDVYEGILTKEGSDQAIKFKYLISNHSIIDLKTLVNKKNINTDFLNKIYESIVYLPNEDTSSIYDAKWKIFLNDVKSKHDSIRYSAFNSLEYLKLKDEDLSSVKDFIENFSFKNEENKYKYELVSKITELSSNEALDFLQKTYQKTFDAKTQLAILKGLADKKNEKSYKLIYKLLQENIPIPNQSSDLNNLFTIFNKNSKFSQSLISILLPSISVPEYKNLILNYLDVLNTEKLLQKKHLQNNLKPILINANLELKRVQSFRFNDLNNENSEHINTYNTIQDLLKYMRVLYPLLPEKEISSFYTKALELKIKEISLQYAILEKYHTKNINEQLKSTLLSNPKTLISTYLLLNDKDSSTKFSENELRESAIITIDDVDLETQSMEYLFSKEKEVNHQNIIFYFYKLSPKEKDATLKQIDGSKNILLSIGFVLDSNKKPLINTFYSGLQKEIPYDEKIEELSEIVIEEAINKVRPNSSAGKITDQTINNPMQYAPF